MAYYFLTASKDASVYLQQPDQNCGLDEVLEVSKVYYGNIKDVSRALLKFDVSNFSSSLSNGSVGFEEATLVLRETESEELPLDFTININPISSSWEMGKGTRFDNIETSGVTWNYREGDSSDRWVNNVVNGSIVFADNSTGSFAGRGGVWYTNYSSSQNFSYKSQDINADITSIFQAWLSGSIQNDGLIVKHENSVEEDTNDYGILRFFSKETNTIHQPKVRIGWDDVSFTTGSLTELTSENIKVGIKNFKKEYKVNTTPKLRVVGRDLYPVKTFSSTAQYGISKFLPTTSYYQIRDYHSDDVIVPFSDYTKLSCDSNGNYFNLNLSNWEVDRVYKIELKVTIDGVDNFFDEDYTFSVIS
jgi:hypothetical protein